MAGSRGVERLIRVGEPAQRPSWRRWWWTQPGRESSSRLFGSGPNARAARRAGHHQRVELVERGRAPWAHIAARPAAPGRCSRRPTPRGRRAMPRADGGPPGRRRMRTFLPPRALTRDRCGGAAGTQMRGQTLVSRERASQRRGGPAAVDGETPAHRATAQSSQSPIADGCRVDRHRLAEQAHRAIRRGLDMRVELGGRRLVVRVASITSVHAIRVASLIDLVNRPGQGCVGQGRKLLSGHRPVERSGGGRQVDAKTDTAAGIVGGHPAAAGVQPRGGRARPNRRYTAWLSDIMTLMGDRGPRVGWRWCRAAR